MRYISVFCIVFVFDFGAVAGGEVREIAGGPTEASRVPAWDAQDWGRCRGRGLRASTCPAMADSWPSAPSHRMAIRMCFC
jgi:hypothetical protein